MNAHNPLPDGTVHTVTIHPDTNEPDPHTYCPETTWEAHAEHGEASRYVSADDLPIGAEYDDMLSTEVMFACYTLGYDY